MQTLTKLNTGISFINPLTRCQQYIMLWTVAELIDPMNYKRALKLYADAYNIGPIVVHFVTCIVAKPPYIVSQ